MIRMENICKIYDRGRVRAVDKVNVTIAPGTYTAILGASGSGKSTLMHLIGLLDRPTSGEYWLCGQPTSGLSARNRAALSRAHIGFVFQSFSLVPGMDALENAALPLAFRGVSREKRLDCAADALCMVGLGARLHHTPEMLSVGQQQRVRCVPTPICCSRTSRPATSTHARRAKFWTYSTVCTRTAARLSGLPTTNRRQNEPNDEF